MPVPGLDQLHAVVHQCGRSPEGAARVARAAPRSLWRGRGGFFFFFFTGENSIACRDDLNDPAGVYSLGSFGQRDHVATDAKIAVVSQFDFARLPSVAISGPTYDQQPPFQWSTSPYASVSHIGLPDLWQVPWVEISWD